MPPVLKSDFAVWLVGDCFPENQKEASVPGGSHSNLMYSFSKNQLPTSLEALLNLLNKKKTDMKGAPLGQVSQQVKKKSWRSI